MRILEQCAELLRRADEEGHGGQRHGEGHWLCGEENPEEEARRTVFQQAVHEDRKTWGERGRETLRIRLQAVVPASAEEERNVTVLQKGGKKRDCRRAVC